MKNSAKKRIIIWSIVSALLVAILIFSIISIPSIYGDSIAIKNFTLFNISDMAAEDLGFSTGNAEFDADSVKSINIGWTSGDVKIKTSTDNKITIEESAQNKINSDNTMIYHLDDKGRLKIYSSKKTISFSIFSFSERSTKTLTVTIPESAKLSELSVESTSAHVNVSNIKSNDLDLSTVSGHITVNQSEGSSLSAETTSGIVDIDAINFLDVSADSISGEINVSGNFREFDASSTSGNITAEIYSSKADEIDISTLSGVIELLLPDDIGGFTAEFDSVSGVFNCDFSGKHYDDTFTYGNGSTDIDISSTSGNATINSFKAKNAKSN